MQAARRGFLGLLGAVALAEVARSKALFLRGGRVAAGSAPTISVAPLLSGASAQGSVLTCSTGTWNNSPTGYAYQWTDNGSNISGATSSTFNTTSITVGHAVACKVTATNAAGSSAPSTSSNSVTVTAVGTKLTAGAGWTGTQNSGFPGGTAPADPTRTTAKPTLRPLWPNRFVPFSDYWFVVDSGAVGGVASVTYTLEGGTPITVTAEQTVSYTDANGVARSVYGFAVQLDLTAVLAKSASGTATLSIEAIASDGTMQHRVMNYTIYPRATEFTDTVTVGASGKTYTNLKAALAFAAANGPGSGTPKRVQIQLADNGANYVMDGLNTDYTTLSWWTVITTAPGVTAAYIGDGTQSQTTANFGGMCFRGAGVVIDLVKVSYSLQGFRMASSGDGSRIWFDGCEITCGTPDPARDGGGSGAGALYRGSEPGLFWVNANAGTNPFEIYYTEVNGHDIPSYGLSFHLLRRHSTAVNIGGSDDENSYCTYGGYADKLGGYWTGQRTYQGAFDITYTGGATLAQFEKVSQPGYPGNFNLYEDSGTPTYTLYTDNGSTWTSMAALIAWINSKPNWHATATASTTELGATYVVLNGSSLTLPLPKTTANTTPVSVKRAADVHAECVVWTGPGATIENVSKRFFEQRRSAGVDTCAVPEGTLTAKDWCHRNISMSDVSATVGEPTQPSVTGAQWRHSLWQYISDTNPSGWSFSGSFDAYCLQDHCAGKFYWSSTPLANMRWTSCFFQQTTAPVGAGANCKTSNVASSTLYTSYQGSPPDMTPINGGTHPLQLADTTWAGRYLPTGAEQGV